MDTLNFGSCDSEFFSFLRSAMLRCISASSLYLRQLFKQGWR
jgi:hypothetical protein